ncbi:MAG TPA: type II CRISPR-associated endonuclease Cas1 [Opitutales bacterium]|nr:type II CRISPR-associated endonuclease Cas1 [Opitutales bacterium]
MSYHIVNIDSPGCVVSCKNGQLTCTGEDGVRQLPLEDVAAIIITSFSSVLHGTLLVEAAKHGVALIICEQFKPVSLMLPANRSSDTLLTKAALELDKKKIDALWRKTVDAKCMNQYLLAMNLAPHHEKLGALEKTATGKMQSKEGTCARFFWGIYSEALGQADFKRHEDGFGLNALLNYGYAVLLSTMLQKLFAVGLDPTLGISHSVRERSTPLAYDLMEPFRPCVDWRVAQWVKMLEDSSDLAITREFRRFVTGFVLERVDYFEIELSIQNCIEGVVRSFRSAVLEHNTRLYRPWIPQGSKWVG